MGKYLGTCLLPALHLSFAAPASQSMISPPSRNGGREQSRAGQSRAEPHFDRIRPSQYRGGDLAVVFFWGIVPTGSWRLQSRKCCGFRADSEGQMASRNRQAERGAGRPLHSMIFSVALVMSCRVLSCPLVSRSLGCRPWVVSQLHSCPFQAVLAATACQCSATNIQEIDAPRCETSRAHTLATCVGMSLLVGSMACHRGLPIDSVGRPE